MRLFSVDSITDLGSSAVEDFACRYADHALYIPWVSQLDTSLYSSQVCNSLVTCLRADNAAGELASMAPGHLGGTYAPRFYVEALNEPHAVPIVFELNVLLNEDDDMDVEDAYPLDAMTDYGIKWDQIKRGFDEFISEPTIIHAQVEIVCPRPVHLLPSWISE
ncbi:hypothetical protein PIIN_07026 [Serendipita indica DSM 11827]|uniref:Uncharacterized protein n=1 Tax=Serendipita indica (strain DSM 11827) TaxID=1109443 RepID=G4TP24_SERID|nr:hypothetical protein PIIN_07026 [Serendipita indica DSM 11827]